MGITRIVAASVAATAGIAVAGCGGGGGTDAFCERYIEIEEREDPFESIDETDLAAMDAAMTSEVDRIRALADAAPDEIAADAEEVVGIFETATGLLSRVEYDFTRIQAEATPEETEALELLGELSTGAIDDDSAIGRIEAFAVENCDGVEPSEPAQFQEIGESIGA